MRPDLTAERFIPDAYGPVAGGRLYRTGDLGRHLPAGDIEYVGRADGQVKVRGYRIELGEIEAVLNEHPAVQEAVVVARGEAAQKRLVGYVVSRTEVSAAELKGYIEQKLPTYMVPSVIVKMTELPLTRNGKLDRQQLPEPEAASREPGKAYEGPRNKTE